MRKGGSYLDDKIGDCVVLDATSAILYKEKNKFQRSSRWGGREMGRAGMFYVKEVT